MLRLSCFGGTRDEKAVEVMKQRIRAFELWLGGVPPVDEEVDSIQVSFVEKVSRRSAERTPTA